MRQALMLVGVLAAGLWLGAGGAWAQTALAPDGADDVHDGYLLLDGRYVPPPYRVRQVGATVVVNGVVVPAYTWSERSSGDDPYGRRRTWREADVIRHRLQEGLLVAVWTDYLAVYFEGPETAYVLSVLLEEMSDEPKRRALAEGRAGWISPSMWNEALERFEPTPELVERWKRLARRYRVYEQADEGEPEESRWTAPRWGVALAAICAFVAGLELLIRIRLEFTQDGPFHHAWRHIDRTDRRAGRVWRMAMMLWVLNGLDLGFTLLADASVGRFRELNPLARRLLDHPYMLSLFKISAALVGTIVLLVLRRRRSAEVAIWWVCLVYTMLMFQWVAFFALVF